MNGTNVYKCVLLMGCPAHLAIFMYGFSDLYYLLPSISPPLLFLSQDSRALNQDSFSGTSPLKEPMTDSLVLVYRTCEPDNLAEPNFVSTKEGQ